MELGRKRYSVTVEWWEGCREPDGIVLERLEIDGKEIPREEWDAWFKAKDGALIWVKE